MRVLALCVALSLAAPVLARGEDLRAVAKRTFDEGNRAFNDKRYADAYELMRKAYSMAPHPLLLFNLARCLEELKRLPEAVETYERYLAVHPDADVERRVGELKRQLATKRPDAALAGAGTSSGSTSGTGPKGVDPATMLPSLTPPPAPPPAPAPVVVAPAPAKPLHTRWWLWTAVGGGVAAIGLGVGLGVGLSSGAPSLTFPAVTLPGGGS